MKISLRLVAALALFLGVPTRAQEAPSGWKTQLKSGGAKTFTPPDLSAGETYSVTVYEAASLGGKSLEAWLRGFAGPVGTKPGQLAAPLKISATKPQAVSAVGVYNGPNGKTLGAMFVGFSFDGASIAVSRTLFSDSALVSRHEAANRALIGATGELATNERAKTQSARVASGVPKVVAENLTLGIPFKPGIYSGTQKRSFSMFGVRRTWLGMRVYLYENGEYRITSDKGEDFKGKESYSTGKIKYNRADGRMDISDAFNLGNDNNQPNKVYCYYGRNAEGKEVIFAWDDDVSLTYDTTLFWEGPPTGRAPQSVVDAPARALEAQKKAAQEKLNRIQTRVAPGQGVPASQVAALVHHFESVSRQTIISYGGTYIIPNFNGPATYGYNAPIYGMDTDITDNTYLLLRDGTIHRGLKVAPDQFDVRASRRKEPENWGLWKREGGTAQMSFAGEPYSEVPGRTVSPGAAQTRLSGRYSLEKGNISFTAAGRFQRSAPPKADASVKTTLARARNGGGSGDLAGTYSISGYALTLRYDSGRIERMLFFLESPKRESVWFEGGWISLVKPK